MAQFFKTLVVRKQRNLKMTVVFIRFNLKKEMATKQELSLWTFICEDLVFVISILQQFNN